MRKVLRARKCWPMEFQAAWPGCGTSPSISSSVSCFCSGTRVTSRLSLLLLLIAIPGASAQTVSRPPSPKEGTSAVQQLSWMAGCWRRQTSPGLVADEQWITPRAGFALGSLRTVRGDSMVVEFHKRGADSLLARIEGDVNGQARAVDFPSARVRCP